jgi:hypothetical protein
VPQAGTHEVLLDDVVRLAQQAATADGEATLHVAPSQPSIRSSKKRPLHWTKPDGNIQ